MDFQFSDDHSMIRDMAAGFASKELAPHAEGIVERTCLVGVAGQRLCCAAKQRCQWNKPEKGCKEHVALQPPAPPTILTSYSDCLGTEVCVLSKCMPNLRRASILESKCHGHKYQHPGDLRVVAPQRPRTAKAQRPQYEY